MPNHPARLSSSTPWSYYEGVRYTVLLAEEFSIEKGEMTPTLKVKRAVIDQKYGGLIDGLYRS